MSVQCTQCTCRFVTFWFSFSFRHPFRLKNVNFMLLYNKNWHFSAEKDDEWRDENENRKVRTLHVCSESHNFNIFSIRILSTVDSCALRADAKLHISLRPLIGEICKDRHSAHAKKYVFISGVYCRLYRISENEKYVYLKLHLRKQNYALWLYNLHWKIIRLVYRMKMILL